MRLVWNLGLFCIKIKRANMMQIRTKEFFVVAVLKERAVPDTLSF